MRELMNWSDEEPPKVKLMEPAANPGAATPVAPKPVTETITFRDINDGTVRSGIVLRAISSGEHVSPRLGKLPVVILYLVAYESATKQNDLAVIWDLPLTVIGTFTKDRPGQVWLRTASGKQRPCPSGAHDHFRSWAAEHRARALKEENQE